MFLFVFYAFSFTLYTSIEVCYIKDTIEDLVRLPSKRGSFLYKLIIKMKSMRLDLKKRTYIYALDVIKFIDSLNTKDNCVEVISKQLLRSVTSIGANIIEAQAGRSKKDFTNFFTHALKSANESKFWLGLLRDSKKALEIKADKLLQEAKEIANILASSILTLKGKKKEAQ